jgi:hypothetical protein
MVPLVPELTKLLEKRDIQLLQLIHTSLVGFVTRNRAESKTTWGIPLLFEIALGVQQIAPRLNETVTICVWNRTHAIASAAHDPAYGSR